MQHIRGTLPEPEAPGGAAGTRRETRSGPWDGTAAQPHADRPEGARTGAAAIPSHDARDLVRQGDRANIVFGDKTYTLRITRAGKLILTK